VSTRLLQSFAGLVVSLSFLQLLAIGRSQLWPVDGESELGDFAVECEEHLIVLVVHKRAGIGADIEVFVPLQDEGMLFSIVCVATDLPSILRQIVGADVPSNMNENKLPSKPVNLEFAE